MPTDKEKNQALYYCDKCGRTMKGLEFYSTYNLDKYPSGKLNQCKKCLTMHVDNWNPETYLWILQEIDIPYIPDQWNAIMAKYAQDPSKLTGSTILGRYISKMKLSQWCKYRWKDSQFLQDLENAKIQNAMRLRGYDEAEITQMVQGGSFDLKEGEKESAVYAEEMKAAVAPLSQLVPAPTETAQSFYNSMRREPPPRPKEPIAPDPDSLPSGNAAPVPAPEDDIDLGLTEEEKTYLSLKWGSAYNQSEWVKLEQLYEEMMQSYDIQTAGHKDTLKLICKTSLKANQLIDCGDIEGYQKVSRVYDQLMKSGRFTAAQNKEENGEFVDSVGELIGMCEKQGYIERYYIEQPNDKVDITIQDLQRYTKKLIEEETNLNDMLEMAIKQNAREDEEDALNTDTDIVDFNDNAIEEVENEMQTEDYTEFEEFKDLEQKADEDYLRSEVDDS